MNTKINFKQAILAGLIAAGSAAVLNSILFFVFQAAGVLTDNILIDGKQALTIVPIIISSILPSMIGSMVFFLFEKFSKNGFKIFTIVSIILVLLSFLNPFMIIKDVTIGYALVLNVMHVVVMGFLLFFIGKQVKSKA